jgi:hypothetical protein
MPYLKLEKLVRRSRKSFYLYNFMKCNIGDELVKIIKCMKFHLIISIMLILLCKNIYITLKIDMRVDIYVSYIKIVSTGAIK